MALVFVHGVSVRKDAEYDNWVESRDNMFYKYIYEQDPASSDKALILNPYWGDLGVAFKFNHSALPDSDTEGFGSNDDTESLAEVLGRTDLEKVPEADQVLIEVARNSIADFIDLIWAYIPPPGNEEESIALANLAFLATQYAEQHAHPDWLKAAANNDLAVMAFIEALEEFEKEQAASEADESEEIYGGKIAKGLSHIKKGVANLIGLTARYAEYPVVKLGRSKAHRFFSQFIGDVVVYIDKRGIKENPGPIVERVYADLKQARDNTPSGGSDKLIVVAHSMGGNIVYDVLTHFHPELEIDLFVTVGSQVGLFEEGGLFLNSAAWRPNDSPPDLVAKPNNIGRWLNVYDPYDPVGFAVERVFKDTSDREYSTRRGLMLSHSSYFKFPGFYEKLHQYIRSL